MIATSSRSTLASEAPAWGQAPRSGLRPLASTRSRAPAREVVACGLGLGLVTLLMCAVHVRNGGFYYDDWGVLALGRFPLPGGLLHGLWLNYGQRPGQVVYYAALDEAFGLRAAPRLALAAAMVLVEATCLYALLRHLGFAARHASRSRACRSLPLQRQRLAVGHPFAREPRDRRLAARRHPRVACAGELGSPCVALCTRPRCRSMR